ncbi:Beta-trefoil DNA-binding domain [Rhizoctonia solani]|uniref:Beta-trefoil DNA-binding domain n=1 Tax=Rhizoctonia solani TaxID=456999 RepID=A0A8H7H7E6_9AGAM|nr:Beta-trefoil DNA-binding domain [Rhizoctonia solani]
MRTVIQTPGLAPLLPVCSIPMERRPMEPPSRANLELLLNAIDDRTATAAAQPTPNDVQTVWNAAVTGSSTVEDSVSNFKQVRPHWLADLGVCWPQSGKRKRDEATSPEESRAKIRRTVRDHLVLDYARVLPTPSMTTVVCLHAAVAQKSYGNEKRFLCPPPVVRVEGPLRQPRTQQLAMRIVTETGERTNEQRATLDETMHASFKTLHVSGPAGFKAKNFQLVLDVSDPDSPLGNTPWASFESSQVAIISKPSKKTAKTRNMSSCILAGGPVSLFNRINSQTVRTKYMAVEQGRLSASNSVWSAFNVTVVRSATESEESPDQVPAQLSPSASSARTTSASVRSYSSSVGARPVTYGSEIILTDALTGVASDPLIIRKVDKSRIINDDGGPVSQMQKIALQRIGEDGQRYYLSASGTITGSGFGGNAGTNGLGLTDVKSADRQSGSQSLHYQAPRMREERSAHGVTSDRVSPKNSPLTTVPAAKFQYTFFDALGTFGTTPSRPITPFPTICTQPTYRPSTHTLELVVSNFTSDDPETGQSETLEIWLGNIGPLRQRIYRSNPGSGSVQTSAPPNVPYAKAAAGALPSTSDQAAVISAAEKAVLDFVDKPGSSATNATGSSSTGVFRRSSVMSPSQTIVVVDMPPIPDIVRTMQENVMSPGHLLAAGLLSQVAQQAQVSRRKDDSSSDTAAGRERSDEAAERTAAIASALVAATEGAAGTIPVVPPEALEPGVPPSAHMTRGLPLLFIRASDGAGYHSGRSVACESVFSSGASGEWVQAAQAVAGTTAGTAGVDPCLTLRIV